MEPYTGDGRVESEFGFLGGIKTEDLGALGYAFEHAIQKAGISNHFLFFFRGFIYGRFSTGLGFFRLLNPLLPDGPLPPFKVMPLQLIDLCQLPGFDSIDIVESRLLLFLG